MEGENVPILKPFTSYEDLYGNTIEQHYRQKMKLKKRLKQFYQNEVYKSHPENCNVLTNFSQCKKILKLKEMVGM